MLMPFGKYKGKPIDSIPCGYLKWILGNCELREPLRTAIRSAYLASRNKTEPAQWDIGRGGVTIHGELQKLYRALSMKWHPDRGGSKEAMQAVNDFYQEVRAIL